MSTSCTFSAVFKFPIVCVLSTVTLHQASTQLLSIFVYREYGNSFVWDYEQTIYFCTEFVRVQFQLLKSCCPLKDLIYCNHSILPCCTFSRYMAPNSVFLSHTTPLIMSSFKKKHTNNTIRSGAVDFGQFQQISVGSSDKTIRIPVILPMRDSPYRKALVTQHYFRKIKHLVTNNTFSHGDVCSSWHHTSTLKREPRRLNQIHQL